MRRLDLDTYFLGIAVAVAARSTCPPGKQHGAVIVDARNRIVSTGYNGPASGVPACEECTLMSDEKGKDWRTCPAIHAEVNALLNLVGTVPVEPLRVYITKKPCQPCENLLMNKNVKWLALD